MFQSVFESDVALIGIKQNWMDLKRTRLLVF